MENSRRHFLKTCVGAACMCSLGGIFRLYAASGSDKVSETAINADEKFHLEWIMTLLDGLNRQNMSESQLRAIIKETSIAHNKHLDVEHMVAPYVGKPKEFIDFLESSWGWKVYDDKNTNTLIVDENKPFCVCPLLKIADNHLYPALCYCSEGFAERMFSTVYGHPVEVIVTASVQRGDNSCIYNIRY